MFDVRGSKAIAITVVSLKIWRNPCQMLVDLRKNPWSGHLAPTRIKYREVRCTQIVHKKRHFLPIRYFQERLKIAYFFFVESVICDHLWERTRRENTEVKPLRNLQTVAIFVFLIQQCLSVYKPAPDPLVLKKMPWRNLFSGAKIKPDREDLHSTPIELFFQVQEIALFMDDLHTSNLPVFNASES